MGVRKTIFGLAATTAIMATSAVAEPATTEGKADSERSGNVLFHPDLVEENLATRSEISQRPFIEMRKRQAVEAAVRNSGDAQLNEKIWTLACSGKLDNPDAVLTHEEQAVIEEVFDMQPSEDKVNAYKFLLEKSGIENDTLATMAAGTVQDYNRVFPIPKCAIDLETLTDRVNDVIRDIGKMSDQEFAALKTILPESLSDISVEDAQNRIQSLSQGVQDAFNNDGSMSTQEILALGKRVDLSGFFPDDPVAGADVLAPQILHDIGIAYPDEEMISDMASSLSLQVRFLDFIRQNEEAYEIFGPLLDYEQPPEEFTNER